MTYRTREDLNLDSTILYDGEEWIITSFLKETNIKWKPRREEWLGDLFYKCSYSFKDGELDKKVILSFCDKKEASYVGLSNNNKIKIVKIWELLTWI